MTITVGIDPGLGGAVAILTATELTLYDMPVQSLKIGRAVRNVLDVPEVVNLIHWLADLRATRVVLERVGGRPGQSASAAFTFGYGYGVLYGACVAARLPILQVDPRTWKKALAVPGKKDGADDAIGIRADELMPAHRHQWRGARGAYKLDRAEAAMLAYYGATA